MKIKYKNYHNNCQLQQQLLIKLTSLQIAVTTIGGTQYSWRAHDFLEYSS